MPRGGVKAGVCLAANARVQYTVFAKTKVCEITLRPIRSFTLHPPCQGSHAKALSAW